MPAMAAEKRIDCETGLCNGWTVSYDVKQTYSDIIDMFFTFNNSTGWTARNDVLIVNMYDLFDKFIDRVVFSVGGPIHNLDNISFNKKIPKKCWKMTAEVRYE
jgi:hypothetical protein